MIGLMVPSAFAFPEYDTRFFQGLPPENAGTIGDEHAHASILIMITDDILDPMRVSPVGTEWIFFEENEASPYGNTIHRFASGVDLEFLFNSLHYRLDDECFVLTDGRGFCTDWMEDHSLKFFINGKNVNDIRKYVIQDGDKILISFGDEHYDSMDPVKQLKLLDQHVILSSSSHDAMVSEKLMVWEKEKSNLLLNDMRYDVLNPLGDVFDNIESDKKLESIISNTIERVSPEAFQELRPNHVDVRSSQFCGIVSSPTISTENKQVFLEMCQSLITLLKEKVSNSLDDVDDNLAIAERKIDQMDIPDTEKNRIKSELNDEVKIATQAMVDVSSSYLTPAQRILDDHKQIQDTRLEISGKGGGCLIATAAFGSEMAPQVQFLRELRDNTVLQTQAGTTFMTGFNQFYYSFSPAVADYERENPMFKEAVKLSLTPLLTSLTILNYVDIDTEQEMLGYGIGVILLNIGMYFVAPAVVIISLKKRFKF